jgi:2-polyprenyl-3-methyl-5-hydroxy-6-metoxy-1,4-benzoquinol methylase
MNNNYNSLKLNKEEKTVYLVKNGYTIFECKKSGRRFLEINDTANHIKEVYSDNYFFEGKQGYPNYLDGKDLLIRYGINYAKIVSEYIKSGKVLEVGCAAGFILKGFEQSGWDCYGIEPNETMATYGRDNLNLNIINGDLETFQSIEKFDLISMIQVIGHLYDVDKALLKVSDLLKEGGAVIVESWDMNSTFAKIMGKYWHEYSPPSVVNWFSDDTLTQLFKHSGFNLVAKGRPSKKISIKHGLSLFEESTPDFIFKKKLIRFARAAIGKFTINYPPLDLKWYLFKKL